MKKLVCLILVLCMALPFTGCAASYPNYVCLSVEYTDRDGNAQSGDIIIELYPDKAPITVENFQKLVDEGFYNGLTFHRVIEGFMIQGGCPYGTGIGGNTDESGKEVNIKGEFAANGVNTGIKHVRGTISMARNGYDYDSASSQFFIVHQTSWQNSYSLDGQYAAFGSVISGMEHVDGIASTYTDYNDKPYYQARIVSAVLIDGIEAQGN